MDVLDCKWLSFCSCCLDVNLESDLGGHAPLGITLVGNLPFGISTPLLVKWSREVASVQENNPLQNPNSEIVIMLQREVAEVGCDSSMRIINSFECAFAFIFHSFFFFFG